MLVNLCCSSSSLLINLHCWSAHQRCSSIILFICSSSLLLVIVSISAQISVHINHQSQLLNTLLSHQGLFNELLLPLTCHVLAEIIKEYASSMHHHHQQGWSNQGLHHHIRLCVAYIIIIRSLNCKMHHYHGVVHHRRACIIKSCISITMGMCINISSCTTSYITS